MCIKYLLQGNELLASHHFLLLHRWWWRPWVRWTCSSLPPILGVRTLDTLHQALKGLRNLPRRRAGPPPRGRKHPSWSSVDEHSPTECGRPLFWFLTLCFWKRTFRLGLGCGRSNCSRTFSFCSLSWPAHGTLRYRIRSNQFLGRAGTSRILTRWCLCGAAEFNQLLLRGRGWRVPRSEALKRPWLWNFGWALDT